MKTSHDSLLVDIDLDRLKQRVADYFSTEITSRHGPHEAGFIRYAYRPFDTRWLYWEADSGLLDRPRPDYKPHVFAGNQWLSGPFNGKRKEGFSRHNRLCTSHLGVAQLR